MAVLNVPGEASAVDVRDAPACIVKITATWCGPCERIHPTFVQLAGEHEVSGFTIDVDTSDDDAQQILELIDAKALPSFVALRHGVELGRCVGSNQDDLRKLFFQINAPQS